MKSTFALSVFSVLVVTACGQSSMPSTPNNSIAVAKPTNFSEEAGPSTSTPMIRTPLEMKLVKVVDMDGNNVSIEKYNAVIKTQNFVPDRDCWSESTIQAFWWSSNAYGHVKVQCTYPGGKFDSATGNMKLVDPNNRVALASANVGIYDVKFDPGPVSKTAGVYQMYPINSAAVKFTIPEGPFFTTYETYVKAYINEYYSW